MSFVITTNAGAKVTLIESYIPGSHVLRIISSSAVSSLRLGLVEMTSLGTELLRQANRCTQTKESYELKYLRTRVEKLAAASAEKQKEYLAFLTKFAAARRQIDLLSTDKAGLVRQVADLSAAIERDRKEHSVPVSRTTEHQTVLRAVYDANSALNKELWRLRNQTNANPINAKFTNYTHETAEKYPRTGREWTAREDNSLRAVYLGKTWSEKYRSLTEIALYFKREPEAILYRLMKLCDVSGKRGERFFGGSQARFLKWANWVFFINAAKYGYRRLQMAPANILYEVAAYVANRELSTPEFKA